MILQLEPGEAYGVQILDDHGPGSGWITRYGWFPEIDPTFVPPDPSEGGLERARRVAERSREDGRTARVVRRDVAISVVDG